MNVSMAAGPKSKRVTKGFHRSSMIVMALMTKCIVILPIILSGVFVPTENVYAQTPPVTVNLRIEPADGADVGDTIRAIVSVMGEGSIPQASDAKLTLPQGWSASGPTQGIATRMNVGTGRNVIRTGIEYTWQIKLPKEGTFDIGPATVKVSGQLQKIPATRIQVSPQGAHPKRQSFLDPFGMFQIPGFGSIDDDIFEPKPSAQEDPRLTLSEAPDATAFLRAFVDKPKALVGEQVTLSIYLYYAGSPRFKIDDPHEPFAKDFFQRQLSPKNSDLGERRVTIQGTPWMAKLIRKTALFPLKSGLAEISPMTVTVVGKGYHGPGVRGGLMRSSQPVTVEIVEPPTDGRPSGYVVGDVGVYSLQASVEPKTVQAGGSVAVTAVLRGTGNLPTSLRLPERNGVQWLEPEIREAIDTGGDDVSGSRSFTYVVQVNQPGAIDLGDITLPYWDPSRKKYIVASAKLGIINVTGSAPAIASASAAPTTQLPPVRTVAGTFQPAKPPFTETRWFWVLLFAAPMLVLTGEAVYKVVMRLNTLRKNRSSHPSAQAMTALAEAKNAIEKNDVRLASTCIERALSHAVDASTGTKLRGLLRTEIVQVLASKGVPNGTAEQIAELLNVCDACRFEGAKTLPDQTLEKTATVLRQLAQITKGAA